LNLFHFYPKHFGCSRNIMMLKTFWHFGDFTLPNSYGTSQRLRKNSFMSKYFEQFRNILMPKKIWAVWEFLCCSIILQIMKVKNVLLVRTILGVFSHGSKYVRQNNIVKMRGYFNPFKEQFEGNGRSYLYLYPIRDLIH